MHGQPICAGDAAYRPSHLDATIGRVESPVQPLQERPAQWVPSHCGVEDNSREDSVTREAAGQPQQKVPVDTRTIACAVARTARGETIRAWPAGCFRSLMGGHLPPPVTGLDRASALDVHQLRAGYWSGSWAYVRRIGGLPSAGCDGCRQEDCAAARCRMCKEELETLAHLLQRCPVLMRQRHTLTGHIHPELEEIRDTRLTRVVAALSAAARLSRAVWLCPCDGTERTTTTTTTTITTTVLPPSPRLGEQYFEETMSVDTASCLLC